MVVTCWESAHRRHSRESLNVYKRLLGCAEGGINGDTSLFTKIECRVGGDASLREAFLRLLTALCARQIPEALHLGAKVSEILGVS